MSFLDTFKLYDRAMPDEQGNLQIIAECFYYQNGNFQTTDDGRVNCTNELMPYDGDNAEKYIISQNNNTFGRLLNDEQLILGYLEENPDSPKHQQQKKYVSDVKSYFRYWYDQHDDINPPEKGFCHSDDYRTLKLDGIEYYPTPKQAHIIQILHRNHINGTPEISQHTIISQIEHEDRETSYSKLREFFNSDDHSKIIYKTFIKKGARRDTFRLNIS